MTTTIDIAGDRPYAIRIGPGLLGDAGALLAPLRGRHALIVSDAHVGPLYAARVADALRSRDGLVVGECLLPAGEASKRLPQFERVLQSLALDAAECTARETPAAPSRL